MTRGVALIALLVLCLPGPTQAQYPFGKNKVIYSKLDWQVLETEHVDIYHYPNEANLIRFAAPLIEETYLEFSEVFGIEFERRVPFVFYASHYDFQQTNILPSLISEYTGGFTDLLKGRVAVPFTGSYAKFRHVVRHEMVHAFMLEKLQQVMAGQGKFNVPPPPLWFVEGMAEYFANSPRNSQAHMFIRDALVHDKLLDLNNIWRISGSYLMYKQGEAVVAYIAHNFGDEAVIRILENWWTSEKFTFVLKNTIGMDMFELSDAWMQYTKRQYYPAILHSRFVTDIGKPLTGEKAFHSRVAATADADGNASVFTLSAEDGVINVAQLELPGTSSRIVAKGSRSARLESIPAFRSKIEAHGDTLLFVSKSSDRDVIYFWSVRNKKEIRRVSFEQLDLLASPTLSGDGRRLAFSAIDDTGQMDIFLYDLTDETLRRVTDDIYADEDPDFHPTDNVLLYTSDRGTEGRRDRSHIYWVDVDSGRYRVMDEGPFADSQAEWAPDGKSFLFTSDRDGTNNIYHHNGDVIVRQTNVLGAVTSAAFLPQGDRFVASSYSGGRFRVFEFELVNGTGQVTRVEPQDVGTEVTWSPEVYTGVQEYNSKPYERRFAVDFVGAGVAIDPEFGDIGNGGQLLLSDVLGNEQINFVFANSSEGLDDFWKRLNAGITYANLSRRINYSLSFFHFSTYSNDFFTVDRQERRYGGALGIRYPLNRFQRIELSGVLRGIERELSLVGVQRRESFTGSLFATYASDHTLWTIGGPITGSRYYVSVGQTGDFLGRGFANTGVIYDVRKYLKLDRRIALALRFRSANSYGGDEQLYYLGGPWSLRGYDWREFAGRSTYLFNSEIRFPLVDRFLLALPFGNIEMPMFRGAAFFDAGRTERYIAGSTNGWKGTLGLGAELNLGFAPVFRLNFTRKTDFATISTDTNVELFIGYNY